MSASLVLIDWALAVIGAVVFLWFIVPVGLGTRPDPLTGCAIRQHLLREDALFFAILAYLLSALTLDSLMERWIADAEDIRRRLVATNGAQVAGALAIAVVVSRRYVGGFAGFLRGAPAEGHAGRVSAILCTALVGIGICPLLAEATVRMVHVFAPSVSVNVHPTLQALQGGAQSTWITLALWLGAAVAAPVAEEFFFRGLLQNVLCAITRRPWIAIVLTAMAFGAVHVSQPHTIPALIVLGLLLGFAYERTGSILVPISIHALFNLKTLVWSALGAPVAG